jgi:hypothetical protein
MIVWPGIMGEFMKYLPINCTNEALGHVMPSFAQASRAFAQ